MFCGKRNSEAMAIFVPKVEREVEKFVKHFIEQHKTTITYYKMLNMAMFLKAAGANVL